MRALALILLLTGCASYGGGDCRYDLGIMASRYQFDRDAPYGAKKDGTYRGKAGASCKLAQIRAVKIPFTTQATDVGFRIGGAVGTVIDSTWVVDGNPAIGPTVAISLWDDIALGLYPHVTPGEHFAANWRDERNYGVTSFVSTDLMNAFSWVGDILTEGIEFGFREGLKPEDHPTMALDWVEVDSPPTSTEERNHGD